ncbi:hypothetical protein RL2676 [Rhizobium johnstonii 3841]|uniref:Uncharacterized protein n=1 Tax=Rhizobium johnstonii (strain DSM 114642 / LMG 32736 / 3841) TaxID=216596 RepID=Q1MFV8_RHIJ3|nr:hypothetical protein RL2676 [Rhizobium johnstonii 3841]
MAVWTAWTHGRATMRSPCCRHRHPATPSRHCVEGHGVISALIVMTSSPSTPSTRILPEDTERHQGSSAHRERSGKSIAVSNRWLVQPGPKRNIEHSGYRRSAFFASLPETPDVRPCADGDGTSIKAHEFGEAHPCLHGCQHHNMVTTPNPGSSIRSRKNRFDLAAGEELHLPLRPDLAWDRKDTLYLPTIYWFLEGQETEEAPDCRQPKVIRRRAGVALGVQIVKERDNQHRIEILQSKIRRKFAGSAMCELQEELECVAVGGNRMWAHVALASKALSKEAFNQSR